MRHVQGEWCWFCQFNEAVCTQIMRIGGHTYYARTCGTGECCTRVRHCSQGRKGVEHFYPTYFWAWAEPAFYPVFDVADPVQGQMAALYDEIRVARGDSWRAVRRRSLDSPSPITDGSVK